MTTAPQSWPCAVCHRPSRPRVHDGCRDRIAGYLLELPSLYRQLADVLQPGRRGNTVRSGTRAAPLPCNLDALDLRARGGIEGVLGSWERDVVDILGWAPSPYRGTVEQAVMDSATFLHLQLPWICEEHPAVKEFASELRQTVAQAERLITGESPPRRITVACPCGGLLRVTLDTPGAKCGGCETQYGHAEVLRLPMAVRAAA